MRYYVSIVVEDEERNETIYSTAAVYRDLAFARLELDTAVESVRKYEGYIAAIEAAQATVNSYEGK